MTQATLTTEAPEEIDVDVLAREFEILALEDFRRLVLDIVAGKRPSADELRQVLFAAKRDIGDVRKFVQLLKRRKDAAADMERAAELEAVFDAYFPEARGLIDGLSARAAYFRELAARADRAARGVLTKLSERQGEWIGLRGQANAVLHLKTTRASQQQRRDLTALIQHRERQIRELNSSSGRFGTAEQIARREEIERLQAMVAGNKHRADLADELQAKQAEFDRLSAVPARRAELEAEITRIRGYMADIEAARNSWADIDFDVEPAAVGSQLPPHETVDPTSEFVHFDRGRPVFSSEFSPVHGGRVS